MEIEVLGMKEVGCQGFVVEEMVMTLTWTLRGLSDVDVDDDVEESVVDVVLEVNELKVKVSREAAKLMDYVLWQDWGWNSDDSDDGVRDYRAAPDCYAVWAAAGVLGGGLVELVGFVIEWAGGALVG